MPTPTIVHLVTGDLNSCFSPPKTHRSTFNPDFGSTSIEKCQDCPAGSESTPGSGKESDCTLCQPGYFSAKGKKCVACKPGTFSATAGATECTDCPL